MAMKHIKLFFCFFLTLLVFSCTKLDENFRSQLEESNSGTITASQLLISAYNSLNTFQNGNIWHVNQHTTDETIAPTRGPDWDDNGQWRALHAHTWNADQGQIRNAFTDLLSAQFAASNVLQFNPSPQQAAEARFIRALSMYMVLDGWGQVPYRENLTDYRITPTTLKGTEATDLIISELTAIIATLPENGEAYVANKNAARALLMKVYLNKGVYVNRAAPTFDAADMTKVISLADEIIGSNKYSLDDNFFDNFAPDNNVKSTENIYTLYNQNGDRGGGVANSAIQGFHYNMSPRGNNGFSTLSDFYDKFEATDQRRGIYYNYAAGLPNPGKRINVGFLEGQQYNLTTDAALQDRKGNPLIFFREVKIRETDPNMLERTGIRVVKYPYDYPHLNQQSDNDWSIFRYADVLLMKAEAQLRSGNTTGPLAIVNNVRQKRGATPMASVDLAKLLDERGREMYWEGWRRQDLIRYGKFLQPWQEKPADDPKNLLFPVPSSQLAVNPNLTQNPGY
jgi:hypothetical protein